MSDKQPIAYRFTHPTTSEVSWLNPADVAVVTESDQLLAVELEAVRGKLLGVHALASNWKKIGASEETRGIGQILLDVLYDTRDASGSAVMGQ